MKNTILGILALAAVAIFVDSCGLTDNRDFNVLVFSKTAGYRHASIPNGIAAIKKMGRERGFSVETSEDASIFQEKNLKSYNVIVFLNTTLDIFDESQQLEFQRWVQAGGGFIGIHGAADTEYDWPWYGQLVGAYFNGHPNDPNVREAVIRRVDKAHVSTRKLPDDWQRSDEWYNYKSINPNINVLLNLDESTYEGGTNGENHPISWYHEFDGGRAWYTGLGHTSESYEEPFFLEHLWGGISYAAGEGKPVDYTSPTVAPEENRFVKEVLDQNLYEPMELELLPNGNILFIERRGLIKLYEPDIEATRIVHKLDVHDKFEDGLLGLALDPNFKNNNWIYLYYSPPGDEPKQHLSRFEYKKGIFYPETEKVLLEVKTQRDECCHAGGSVEFGPDGNLFLSTGDDTNPFASDGYSPSDEQEGRKPWDAQRSSASPNDLRGKILRIKPEPDGTYSIPEGNLFPVGMEGTRPEIFVMGCRNPFRIAIDKRTKYLYWGDVGPDAGKDSLGRGPRGYDEVNQARQAGFFGWPYFVGNNYAYNDYNFATKVSLDPQDIEKPINLSPNNTGKKDLPPAKPAFIWYPYAESPDFPLVGEGGRNAMAAGVYYYDDFMETDKKFPKYYDKKLFTYDWMRGWFMAVTMNEEGDLLHMERFLPSIEFNNPVDVVWSPDGDIFLLEYGTLWFQQNADARLVHLKYIAGNREPKAIIETPEIAAAAPFTVNFKGGASQDPDGDEISFEWTFDGNGVQSNAADPSYTFNNPGEYEVTLVVKDAAGKAGRAKQKILVGNDMPELSWNIKGSSNFFMDNQNLEYEIVVNDSEDGKIGAGIDPSRIKVSIDYLERGSDVTEIAQGHQELMEASAFYLGKQLMDNSDCGTCHQLDQKSIGPTYRQIAEKYIDDPKAIGYLSDKIINGGGGVWGDQAMAAHPQLKKNETEQMVKYILSLEGWAGEKKGLPHKGTYALKDHIGKEEGGVYILSASYTDKGGDRIGPLTARQIVQLRHPRIPAASYNILEKAIESEVPPGEVPGLKEALKIVTGGDEGYVVYQAIGLDGVSSIDLGIGQHPALGGGKIELRLDDPKGQKIGELEVIQGADEIGIKTENVTISPVSGTHDLYVCFVSESDKPVSSLIFLEFKGELLQ